MNQFIPLKLNQSARKLNRRSVLLLKFHLNSNSNFNISRQHLTIRHISETGEIRRCYSICSDTQEDMSIAIKRLNGDNFQTGPITA